jgi:hypothetical protein
VLLNSTVSTPLQHAAERFIVFLHLSFSMHSTLHEHSIPTIEVICWMDV